MCICATVWGVLGLHRVRSGASSNAWMQYHPSVSCVEMGGGSNGKPDTMHISPHTPQAHSDCCQRCSVCQPHTAPLAGLRHDHAQAVVQCRTGVHLHTHACAWCIGVHCCSQALVTLQAKKHIPKVKLIQQECLCSVLLQLHVAPLSLPHCHAVWSLKNMPVPNNRATHRKQATPCMVAHPCIMSSHRVHSPLR